MSDKVRRRTIDLPDHLWYQVGIESAKLDIKKREFVIQALEEKIARIKQEENNED